MWTLRAVVALAAVATGCNATEAPVTSPTPAELAPNATLDWVIDGDTIDVVLDDGRTERVRLTGIDTPEVARDATDTRPAVVGECFADEADAFVRELLPVGTPLRLERDVVGRDDFGRLLAYVYRSGDGIFVNYEIVRQGYAQPLTIPPNVAFSDVFVDAARAAEADDIGLWSTC